MCLTEAELYYQEPAQDLHEPKFWSLYTLLETADIGGAPILQSICDQNSHTYQALEKLGLVGMRLAGSITLGSGNYYCSEFDEFSREVSATNSGQPINVTNPTGDPDIDNSWKLTRALGIDNLPNEAKEARSFSQILDFLTGRNADLLIKLAQAPTEDSISAIYDALVATLPQDINKGKYIISLAKHAGRLPLIQIHNTKDKYNQGINIIFEMPGDTWNNSTSGRMDEVVGIAYEDGVPGIFISRAPKNEPSRLLRNTSSLGELMAILSQELRRSVLYPDRGGIDFAEYIYQLKKIDDQTISHEQACLIADNLARAYDRDPKHVEQLFLDLRIGHHFGQNDPDTISHYMTLALSQIFVDFHRASPYLVKLLATVLPMMIEDFIKMIPTPHPVIRAQVLDLDQI